VYVCVRVRALRLGIALARTVVLLGGCVRG